MACLQHKSVILVLNVDPNQRGETLLRIPSASSQVDIFSQFSEGQPAVYQSSQ